MKNIFMLKPLINIFRYIYKAIVKFNVRRKLKNKDFTLITSTCISGVIYNLCGLKFDSPTIQLWISQTDFCKFCSDLEYYLNQKLEFINNSGYSCPVATLGGEVTVVFVHYKTEKEAQTKWQMRKKRIHWNNLYIISSDGNGATLDDFKKLENVKCKRKIIFTSRHRPEIKDSFYLKSLTGRESAAEHMIIKNRISFCWTWLDDWDFVAWLNGEEKFEK